MTDGPRTVPSNDKRASDRTPAEVLAFLNELIAAGVPYEAQPPPAKSEETK